MASLMKKTLLYLGLGSDEDFEAYDDEMIDDRVEQRPAAAADQRRPERPRPEPARPTSSVSRPTAGGNGVTVRPVPPPDRQWRTPPGVLGGTTTAGLVDRHPPRHHARRLQRRPGDRRSLQGEAAGHHEPPARRPSAVAASDRFRQRPVLRPRRAHGARRRRRVSADPLRRAPLCRRPSSDPERRPSRRVARRTFSVGLVCPRSSCTSGSCWRPFWPAGSGWTPSRPVDASNAHCGEPPIPSSPRSDGCCPRHGLGEPPST